MKMKRLKQKLRWLIDHVIWERVGWLALSITLAAGIGYGYWRDMQHPTQLVEYRKEVEEGDTLWGIVAKVATDKEDMSKLTWQVMQDNRISDPGHLQPGRELVIRVKAAREL